MACNLLALVALFTSAAFCSAGARQECSPAVLYKEIVYLSVDRLTELLQGTNRLSPQARDVVIEAQNSKWEFIDGGLRLRLFSGKERPLKHLLLVLEGKHYFPIDECAGDFGYRVVAPKKEHPSRVLIVHAGKEYSFELSSIVSPYHRHAVEKLEPAHEFVTVQAPLRGLRALHRKEDVRTIPLGTTLLVRRRVVFDGQPHVIASDCGESLESYLIRETTLRRQTNSSTGAETVWSNCHRWFAAQGNQEAALRHGNRKQLDKTVALTVDLCWSLRPYETKLLQSLKQLAAQSEKTIHPVFFVCGRWLEQHPLEMHNLIELGLDPKVNVVWGHHSWQHPKSGGFMNDLPPAELREDTLRLERLFLQWGIVPTVYYRFPGLIHDRVRLREILDLDLLPIDCDSWLALVRDKERGPFYYHAKAGSIILIHGNGNEPFGVLALDRWLHSHQHWELGHLNRFIAQ